MASTGGVPYLGSKISLISKSEIRYEGILYTIDTKDSTVALSKGNFDFLYFSCEMLTFCQIGIYVGFFRVNSYGLFRNHHSCSLFFTLNFLFSVRSFGTEDRPTDRPVAPRDEVYEYIIFRGTDIKDIRVCQPPPTLKAGLPNDPAIVRLRVHVPNHETPEKNRGHVFLREKFGDIFLGQKSQTKRS